MATSTDCQPAVVSVSSSSVHPSFWRKFDMDNTCLTKVDQVKMYPRTTKSRSAKYPSNSGSKGTLYVTTSHLIFVDSTTRSETRIFQSHIESAQKLSIHMQGVPLLIKCKNFRVVTFILPSVSTADAVSQLIYQLSRPNCFNDLYCFRYPATDEPFQGSKKETWAKFNLLDEFERQGVPNKYWTVSNLNVNYQLCESYPRYLLVPAKSTASMLQSSADFRSRNRLPVLTYRYKNDACICRSSQPLSGFSHRCKADESLLREISRSTRNSKFLYVVDARPRKNAYFNKAIGKGFETVAHYDNIKFHFFPIENVCVVRSRFASLLKTAALFHDSQNAFTCALKSSGWLKHLKSMLDAASFVARSIVEGTSVVVHCSDGWDRTPQTCSIAGLLIDPYYRTIDGFQALIEKEWLAFGHKFSEKCGHIRSGDDKKIAPMFTQFLDCVWQIQSQHPCEFEFNEKFLILLHDHIYSCQFGNFIGNRDKDRTELKVTERTYSLWAFMDARKAKLVNPLYYAKRSSQLGGSDEVEDGPISVDTSPHLVKYWAALYNRFDQGLLPQESEDKVALSSLENIQSLEQEMKKLKGLK